MAVTSEIARRGHFAILDTYNELHDAHGPDTLVTLEIDAYDCSCVTRLLSFIIGNYLFRGAERSVWMRLIKYLKECFRSARNYVIDVDNNTETKSVRIMKAHGMQAIEAYMQRADQLFLTQHDRAFRLTRFARSIIRRRAARGNQTSQYLAAFYQNYFPHDELHQQATAARAYSLGGYWHRRYGPNMRRFDRYSA